MSKGYRIIGTGVDIVENDRMADMLDKWGKRFKDKVFLSEEQAYCDCKAAPVSHYAGRFAVKEAVSKAFGTGIGEHIGWLDIEVTKDLNSGAPSVKFSDRVRVLMTQMNAADVLISFSHTRNYSVAQAVLVSDG